MYKDYCHVYLLLCNLEMNNDSITYTAVYVFKHFFSVILKDYRQMQINAFSCYPTNMNKIKIVFNCCFHFQVVIRLHLWNSFCCYSFSCPSPLYKNVKTLILKTSIVVTLGRSRD